MNLIDFKEILDKDDFTTAYFEKNKQLPFDRLNVVLPVDLPDKIILEMLFSPGMDAILKGFKLFQYFVRLPFDLDSEAIPDLKSFLLKLNMGIPLMGFGLNEEDGYLYFKSLIMIPNQETISEDLVSVMHENVYLVGFIFNRFYPLIRKVATGEIELNKALKQLV